LSGCLAGCSPQEAVDVAAGGPLGLDGKHTPSADDDMGDTALGERYVGKHLSAMNELAERGRRPLLGVGAHRSVSEPQSDVQRMSELRQPSEQDPDEHSGDKLRYIKSQQRDAVADHERQPDDQGDP
jgi:hypothetical protein